MANDKSEKADSGQAKRCVSWGELDDKWNMGASDIVLLKEGEEALLPHIDTCVGLVCRLKNGRVLIAHASSIPKPTVTEQANLVQDKGASLANNQGEALQRMHTAITQTVGADQLQGVTAIGPSDWQGHVKAFFTLSKFISTDNYSNGVDVVVDDKANLAVSTYKSSASK